MKVTKVAPVVLDDRNGMERVADELINFTKSAQNINTEQSQSLIKILTALIKVLENIGKDKPIVMNRPTEWNLKITNRDSKGYIEGVKLVANESNKILN